MDEEIEVDGDDDDVEVTVEQDVTLDDLSEADEQAAAKEEADGSVIVVQVEVDELLISLLS